MSADVYWNIAASWPATVATFGLLGCAALYGAGSPWYRSFLGVIFFGVFLSTTPVFALVVVSRLLGVIQTGSPATTGDGLGVFRFVVYSFSAIFSVAMLGAIAYYRSHAPTITIPVSKERTMSDTTPGPDHLATSTGSEAIDVRDHSGSPFTLANAKKAYSAGVAGAIVGAGGAITTGGVFADGKLDGNEVATVLGAIVVGFVGGFVAAFIPTNGTKIS